MRHRLLILTIASVCLSATSVFAAIEFDQNVTNNAIWGSGNSNGGFTTDRNATLGIELGLRAKTRYPVPSDSPAGIMSQGNGTYGNFAATGHGPGNERGSWNVDWSINSNYNQTDSSAGTGGNLNIYTYTLELDYDPGWGTSFQSAYGAADPINGTVADHSFGDNSTAAGAGVEAVSVANYGTLIGSSNLAQNSLNWDFYDVSDIFDPTVDGRYTVRLTAYDNSGALAAQSEIHVMVGNGVVPEPASLLTWGGIISCVSLIRRLRIG